MSCYTVSLPGPGPWGFRLQGGKDFNMPLTISRITPGSKAAMGNLIQGDVIVAIDGVSTDGMTHLEAQNKIKMANYNLALTMSKSKRPVQLAAPRMDSISLIPHQQSSRAAQGRFIAPFCPGGLKDPAHKPIEVTGPGGKATIIHAQYNTPISMYSQDSIMDAIAGQTQAKGQDMGIAPLVESVVDSSSAVYQAVLNADRDPEQREWGRRTSMPQSRSFQALVHLTGTDSVGDEEELQRSRSHHLHHLHFLHHHHPLLCLITPPTTPSPCPQSEPVRTASLSLGLN
ncbi:LIM domain-binding protein 3-like [Boleophthalmus pectinirostris]|uniref:LIM domain-binding protein 3-like n=1 Tax=Boleophthalmus pectinirostris TaxID=150288 RepID=UPI00242C7FF1|nr:LIM domain-binding protein 3-like [Boleophthalmus pectinirostris]